MVGNRVNLTVFILILGLGVFATTLQETQHPLDIVSDHQFAKIAENFAELEHEAPAAPSVVNMAFVEEGEEAFNYDEGRKLTAQEAQAKIARQIDRLAEKAKHVMRAIEHLEKEGYHGDSYSSGAIRKARDLLNYVRSKRPQQARLLKTLEKSGSAAARKDAKVLGGELKEVRREAKDVLHVAGKVCKKMSLAHCKGFAYPGRLPKGLVDKVRETVKKYDGKKESADKTVKKLLKVLKRAKNSLVPRGKRVTAHGIHKHMEIRLQTVLKKLNAKHADKIFKAITKKLAEMHRNKKGLLRLGDKARLHGNCLGKALKHTIKSALKRHIVLPNVARKLKKRIFSVLLRAQASRASGKHATGVHKHFLEKLAKVVNKNVKKEAAAKDILAKIHKALEFSRKSGRGLIASGKLKKKFKERVKSIIASLAEDKKAARKLTRITFKVLRRAKRTKVHGRISRIGIPTHLALRLVNSYKENFKGKNKAKAYKAIRAVFGAIKQRFSRRYISLKFRNLLKGVIKRSVKDRKQLRKVHKFVVKALNRAKRSKVPMKLSSIGIPVHIARYIKEGLPKLFKKKELGKIVLRDVLATIWDKKGIHGVSKHHLKQIRLTIGLRVKDKAVAAAVRQAVIRNLVRSSRSKVPLKVGPLGIRSHIAVMLRDDILKAFPGKDKTLAHKVIRGVFKTLKRANRDSAVRRKIHKQVKTAINAAITDKKQAKRLYWQVIDTLVKDRKSKVRHRRNRLGLASHIGMLLRERIRDAFPGKKKPGAVTLMTNIFNIIKSNNRGNIVSPKLRQSIKKALKTVIKDKKVRRALARQVRRAIRRSKKSRAPGVFTKTGLPRHILRGLFDIFRKAIQGKNKAPAFKAFRAVTAVLKKKYGKGVVKGALRNKLKKIIFEGISDKAVRGKLFHKVYNALARSARSKVPATRLSRSGIPVHIARYIYEKVRAVAPVKKRQEAHKVLKQIFDAIKGANPNRVKNGELVKELKGLLSSVVTDKKIAQRMVGVVVKTIGGERKNKKLKLSSRLGISVKGALAIRDGVRAAVPGKKKEVAVKALRIIFQLIKTRYAPGAGSKFTRRRIKQAIRSIVKDAATAKKMIRAVKFVLSRAKVSKVPLVLGKSGLQTHLMSYLRDQFRNAFPAKKRRPAFQAFNAVVKIFKESVEIQGVSALLLRRLRHVVKTQIKDKKIAEGTYHGIADALWRAFKSKVTPRVDENGLPTHTTRLIVDRTVKALAGQANAKQAASSLLHKVFKLIKNSFTKGTVTRLLLKDLKDSVKKVKGVDKALAHRVKGIVIGNLVKYARSKVPKRKLTRVGLPLHITNLIRNQIRGLIKTKDKTVAVSVVKKVFKVLKRRFAIPGIYPRVMNKIRRVLHDKIEDKKKAKRLFRAVAKAFLKQKKQKGELKLTRLGLTQENALALKKTFVEAFDKKNREKAFNLLRNVFGRLKRSFARSQRKAGKADAAGKVKVLHSAAESREYDDAEARKPMYTLHNVEIPQMFRKWFEERYNRQSLPRHYRTTYADVVRAWRITKRQRRPEAVHELLRALGEHPQILDE